MSSSSTSVTNDDAQLKSGLGPTEFIILIAALTSVVAISIDAMLPALSTIGRDFSVANPNDQQFVIVAFMAGFGLSQIIFGPLSDSLGRKPILLFGMIVFAVSSYASAFAPSFFWLIVLRITAGIGASAVRITTTAIVRDCYAGRGMARVMSFVFTVFMIVPIIAPAAGQGIMAVANWQTIFLFLGIFGTLLTLWGGWRMQETLAPENVRPLSFVRIMMAFREILTNRLAFGYTIASTLFFGSLFSMVISIPQIIEVTFNAGNWFAAIFAFTASVMAIGTFANGRLVESYGMRGLSHRAAVGFVFFGGVLLVASLVMAPPLWLVMILIALTMGTFGFIAGNFQSIAMVPLGHIAGSASSVLGLITFTGGALLGAFTGQMFDGTVTPLASAFFFYGAISLFIVFWTEKGRLFGTDAD